MLCMYVPEFACGFLEMRIRTSFGLRIDESLSKWGYRVWKKMGERGFYISVDKFKLSINLQCFKAICTYVLDFP